MSESSDDEGKYRCCVKRDKLRSLTHGAFYFSRLFVVGSVSSLLAMCCVLDAVNVIRAPAIVRQAKKSARGMLKLMDLVKKMLSLSRVLLEEEQALANYKSSVRCAARQVDATLARLSWDCSYVDHLMSDVAYLWNTTEETVSKIVSRQLNCSTDRPFWHTKASLLHSQCRDLCNIRTDVETAHGVFLNLTYDAFVAQAYTLSSSVYELAGLIVTSENLLNGIALTLGLGDTYFDFGHHAQDVADTFGGAAQCLVSVYGLTELPAPRQTCQGRKEFRSYHQVLRYVEKGMDWADYAVDIVDDGLQWLVWPTAALLSTLWLVAFCVHAATLVFLEYVVFAPNIPYDKYWDHVRHSLFARVDLRRTTNKIVPKLVERTSEVTVNRACDSSYVVRWWLLYILHDAFFFFIIFLLLFNLLLLAVGDKRSCTYFYSLNPYVRTSLRQFVDSAVDSCFVDLAAHDIEIPPESVERCTVRAWGIVTAFEYRVSLLTVMVACNGLVVLQWILLHWLSTTMAFARPKPLRSRLKKLKFRDDDDGYGSFDSLDSFEDKLPGRRKPKKLPDVDAAFDDDDGATRRPPPGRDSTFGCSSDN